jgi:hypothetical protein
MACIVSTATEAEGCESEITEEMIEAGEDALLRRLGGADLGGFFSAAELACEVYRAMTSAHHRARPKLPTQKC